MATFMVTCTFREGTDMTEVFATIEEEQAQAAALVAEGRRSCVSPPRQHRVSLMWHQ
jgi:hypothetical protein